MILPNVRASFGRRDALHLVDLVARDDDDLREAVRKRLDEEGIDTLLDDPRVLNALLTDTGVKATPPLVFYVMVRQALLENGVDDPGAADYVTSLVLAFGMKRRAYRISDAGEDEYRYLVDMVARLRESSAREAFLLRAHMGNFSLWITGLFPDYIESRERRKGAPPVGYYEQMGTNGYRLAACTDEARTMGVETVFNEVADHFAGVRGALNQVADRYLWPEGGDPVGRLLREVTALAPSVSGPGKAG